jgi:hypothetical protein
MTQAFNLSQLANRVNTSGQLNAATGLFNQVPVANGGTGKSSVTSGRLLVGAGTSAMTELAGTTVGQAVAWNGTTWVAGTVGGAMPQISPFVAPGVWDATAKIAAGLKGIKVTVVGAGGNGGGAAGAPSNYTGSGGGGGGGGAAIEYIPAPSIPGPVNVTAGPGTNSFGAFCSATAGSAGVGATNTAATFFNIGGAGGVGSGGNVNINGGAGVQSATTAANPTAISGAGGNSILGGGAVSAKAIAPATPTVNGINGGNYGGGGSGGAKASTPGAVTGGAGAPGIVIIEEFY